MAGIFPRVDSIQENPFRKKKIPKKNHFDVLLHSLVTGFTTVGVGGQFIVLVGLAQHQLVVAQPEGVPVHGHGVKVHIGVASFGLTGRASIKIPDWQFCKCKQTAETSGHLVKPVFPTFTIHKCRES